MLALVWAALVPSGLELHAAIGLVDKSKLPSGVAMAVGQVEKQVAPLFIQDKPWEPRLDNGYPNVVYDPTNHDGHGIWRCWYGDCVEGCGSQVLLFANSSDGLKWEKPELGLFDVGKVRKDLAHIGTRNNILLKGGGIGIYSDPHEVDPTKKYKAFGSGCFGPGGDTGCVGGVSTSPDGLTFGNAESIHWPAPQRYDCHSNLFWDESHGAYLATTRDGFSHGSGRDIGMAWSKPGQFKWSTATAPALVEQGTAAHQLYSQITWAWGGIYLGIVMVFDAPDPVGRVHCRLSWSPDGANWSWVDPGGLTGKDFIPLGQMVAGGANAFDSHICFAAAYPVELANQNLIRLYYMGGNGPHNGDRNSSLGLATLGLDRYAGVTGTGKFVTKAVAVTGSTLFVTADVAAGGSLKIGAVGVPRLSAADASALSTNVTRAAVVFAGGATFASLVGKSVTLELELAGAIVYTVGFGK